MAATITNNISRSEFRIDRVDSSEGSNTTLAASQASPNRYTRENVPIVIQAKFVIQDETSKEPILQLEYENVPSSQPETYRFVDNPSNHSKIKSTKASPVILPKVDTIADFIRRMQIKLLIKF